VSAQRAMHFVQVPIDLFERTFDACEQSHQVRTCGHKPIEAKFRECRIVAVNRLPTGGGLRHSAFDARSLRRSKFLDECINGDMGVVFHGPCIVASIALNGNRLKIVIL